MRILLVLGLMFSGSSYAAQCGAMLNGREILLEQNPLRPGVYLIKLEDPAFNEIDVVINASEPNIVRASLARFVSDAELPAIQTLLAAVPEKDREKIRSHFRPRAVSVMVGYTKDGEALIELTQDTFKLTAACRR